MMLRKLLRLFTIKNRLEAYAVIYAIAVGTVSRGYDYLDQYPGSLGYLLFAACTGVVFMAGAKILDSIPPRKWSGKERRAADRRIGSLST